MVDFWKSSSKVCKQPFIGLFKNPPGFSPAGENSVPRQGFKAFNLKAKFTDRLNILRKIYARFTQDVLPIGKHYLKIGSIRGLCFKLKRFYHLFRAEFRLAEGKFRRILQRTKRGCLHTLESSAKIHQSFATGKMPRNKALFP